MPQPSSILNPSGLCLLHFLDETGHEQFADPQYPIFGIGGCAALAESSHRLVDVPWRQMKQKFFGSETFPLHASSTLATATAEQRQGIVTFFRENLFSRFAAVIQFDSPIPHEFPPYQIVAGTIYNRIGEIANPYPLDSLALIFEASDRGNKLAQRYFGSFRAEREGHGNLPIHRCFMKKNTQEPCLEIADFIINTAGRHVRHKMKTGLHEPNDLFTAIFQSVPKPLVSYISITSAQATPPPTKA